MTMECSNAALAIGKLADSELGKQRGVARQKSQVALEARHLDLVHLFVNEGPFGRDDLQVQKLFTHYAPVFMELAFSRTSSMVPTM